MSIEHAIDSMNGFFYDLLGKEILVISITPTENGWESEFEMIYEDEYMRKRGRKEIIAIYECIMDSDFKIVSYTRKNLKERGALE